MHANTRYFSNRQLKKSYIKINLVCDVLMTFIVYIFTRRGMMSKGLLPWTQELK